MTAAMFPIPMRLQGLKTDSLSLSKLGWSFYGLSNDFHFHGKYWHGIYASNEDKTKLGIGTFYVPIDFYESPDLAKHVAQSLSRKPVSISFPKNLRSLPEGALKISPWIDLENHSSDLFTYEKYRNLTSPSPKDTQYIEVTAELLNKKLIKILKTIK